MDVPASINGLSREACYASSQVQESLARNFAKLCVCWARHPVESALRARMSKKTFELFLLKANLFRHGRAGDN